VGAPPPPPAQASDPIRKIPVVLRPGARGAVITFAPTRSRIIRAQVRGKLSGPHSIKSYGPLVLNLHLGEPVSSTDSVEVAVEYEGEPLVGPSAESYSTAQVAVDADSQMPVLAVQRYSSEYSQRSALATTPYRRYFFEIDRKSNALLLPFAPDVTDAERTVMRSAFDSLLRNTLIPRLQARFDGTPSALNGTASELQEVAKIFLGAAAILMDDPGEIAAAHRAFAAGALRGVIPTPDGTGSVPVFEPDSASLYLFAEVALASIDMGVEALYWEALLPALVEKQEIYLLRFKWMTRGPWCLSHYGVPPPPPVPGDPLEPLFTTELAAIRTRYALLDTRAKLEDQMYVNLISAGSCFGTSIAT